MEGFRFNEKYLSQIPALQVLVNLGYTYLTPEQALSGAPNREGDRFAVPRILGEE